MTESNVGVRRRMSKKDRHAQLLDVARGIIREDGTDALALSRVAEYAQVAKPVVYDHFGDRSGLLAELYREFDARQHTMLDAALENAEDDVADVARIVATSYIECSVAEGRELADVIDALTGSPILEQLRQDAVDAYIVKCKRALSAYVAPEALGLTSFRAVIGAADALARAVVTEQTSLPDAVTTLSRVIIAVVTQNRSASSPSLQDFSTE